MARQTTVRKTAVQKWEELPPPEKLVAYSRAGGQILGNVVAAGVFVATGAEVFHLAPDFIDPTRAMDIFAALSAYYGIPLIWAVRPGRTR